MIRMLLLCLTIFVASSSADEDSKETLAFKKLVSDFGQCMKKNHRSFPAGLFPFEVQNGIETEKFTATSSPFSFHGIDDIRSELPCQKKNDEENTILCFAVYDQSKIQANMTIKGESLPKSISFEYSNIYKRSMLVFAIEKNQDSLVKVKSVHLVINFFIPPSTELRDIERTPIINKALQVANEYQGFSLSYFVKRHFAGYFNAILNHDVVCSKDD